MGVHANTTTVPLLYLKIDEPKPAGVPSYLTRSGNSGIDGATIALEDANKTGKFLGYQLKISTLRFTPSLSIDNDQNAVIKATSVILLDSPSSIYEKAIETVVSINPNALVFNIANYDNAVRTQHCNFLLLHTIPTFQMRTDALGQWLRTKRIKDIFIVKGQHGDDTKFATAFMGTAKKFKLNIVDTKDWQHSFDLRRSAFSEIPQFTRSSDEYNALFTADALNQFAFSLPYNTYYQVPVIGDAGLVSENWHRTHEQWGARQLQNRFIENYKRTMNDIDYSAYVAIIAVSTSLQQGSASSGQDIYTSLLSDNTAIAAYKGRKLSFRKETRQLRQPILLANENALVTHAPLPGFLHQTNDLDTLGNTQATCEGRR